MRTLAAAAVRPGRALPALRPARGCARAAAGSRAGGGMRARGGARALGEDARSRGRASGARMRVRARGTGSACSGGASRGHWLAGWLADYAYYAFAGSLSRENLSLPLYPTKYPFCL